MNSHHIHIAYISKIALSWAFRYTIIIAVHFILPLSTFLLT